MTVLALCNIGLRDVLLDHERIEPTRTQGQQLWHQYDGALAARLSLPILIPSLHYILQQEEGGLDRLVLYGTDQPADSRHHANDTRYVADLAARRLVDLLGTHIAQVETAYVRGINPSLYDEALEAFDRLLIAVADAAVDRCYVILCGGIPACNTALLFHGVRQFGDRLRVVYTPVQGAPQELRASAQVMSSFREAAALEQLKHHDFASALPILEELGTAPGLRHLVAYAEARLNFDFRTAQRHLQAALRDGDRDLRTAIAGAGDLLSLQELLAEGVREPMAPTRILALLRELYWNAAITYQHQRYADFLGRIYRFQEAALRYLVEMIYGLSTDLHPALREQTQQRWEAAISANTPLVTFLAAQDYAGRGLAWRDIGRPTYKALLNYAVAKEGVDAAGRPLIEEGGKTQPNWSVVLDRLNGLDRLVDLRHRSIIGHDFEGVSLELILANFKAQAGEQTPVERLAHILGMLRTNVRCSPYDFVSDYVTRRVRRPGGA